MRVQSNENYFSESKLLQIVQNVSKNSEKFTLPPGITQKSNPNVTVTSKNCKSFLINKTNLKDFKSNGRNLSINKKRKWKSNSISNQLFNKLCIFGSRENKRIKNCTNSECRPSSRHKYR